jgi:hypothetical protein
MKPWLTGRQVCAYLQKGRQQKQNLYNTNVEYINETVTTVISH